MRTHLTIVIMFLFLLQVFVPTGNSSEFVPTSSTFFEIPEELRSTEDAQELLSRTPNAFTENQGQLENEAVRFYDQGGSLWFTDDGVWFDIREEEEQDVSPVRDPYHHYDPVDALNSGHTERRGVTLKQEFVGCNDVEPVGVEDAGWYSNFFYGSDPEGWRSRVPNWIEVWYYGLWDGIDLRYYVNDGQLKYEFIVNPGADHTDIAISYEGAEDVRIDGNGDLVITTPHGILLDKDLNTFSLDTAVEIGSQFRISDSNNIIVYLEDSYPPDEVIVVDPVLEYATYVGGTLDDQIFGTAISSTGEIVFTGKTESNDFPTTLGCYNDTFNASGNDNVIVGKFSTTGSSLLFATYVGGSGESSAYDIEIDNQGHICVGGYSAGEFPTTNESYDPVGGGWIDCIVFKLSGDGSTMVWSTYVGGERVERVSGLSIDDNGNVYCVGTCTYGGFFPITSGVVDTTYAGDEEGIVFKLSSNGSSLEYSSYLGGYGKDILNDIHVDDSNNAYIVGHSYGFPTTSGAYQTTNKGAYDVIVCKVNTDCSAFIYSTYMGGSDNDAGWELVVDKSDYVYVTGTTYSSDYYQSPGTNGTSGPGSILFKLDPLGASVPVSTVLPGGVGYGIDLDKYNNIYLSGLTNSKSFPLTDLAIDDVVNHQKGYLTKMDPNATHILYSTLICIMGVPCMGVKDESAYICGYAGGPAFSATKSAFDTSPNGEDDGFMLKITPPLFFIKDVQILEGEEPVTELYSRYRDYTLRVTVSQVSSKTEPDEVNVIISPSGENIKLTYFQDTGTFESNDINGYIELSDSSKAITFGGHLIVDFDVKFDWTYPHENLVDVHSEVFISGAAPWSHHFNVTEAFSVENDLVLKGNLTVTDAHKNLLQNLSLLGGGSKVLWRGPVAVYEGTTDIFPADEEFNITISDEHGYEWICSPLSSEELDLETVLPFVTDLEGDLHTVSISEIPSESDKSDVTFNIRIDSHNISYSDPMPSNISWQTTSTVTASVMIGDTGGGLVDASSIEYRITTDGGIVWMDWNDAGFDSDAGSIVASVDVDLPDGDSNMIQWRASDTTGNGPQESLPHLILVDTGLPLFSNPSPDTGQTFYSDTLWANISADDLTSGVDADSAEYCVSYDGGSSWKKWVEAGTYNDGETVNISVEVGFPDGDDNLIKFRISDIAGNGPVESEPITVDVQKWIVDNLVTTLLSPEDEAYVITGNPELAWTLKDDRIEKATYEVYLDTVDPPVEMLDDKVRPQSITARGLEENGTYYWTVIPRYDGLRGTCSSNVWSFTYVPVDDELDSDGDGMPDDWEEFNGLDPDDPRDADDDPDDDGVSNLEEYLAGLNPNVKDAPVDGPDQNTSDNQTQDKDVDDPQNVTDGQDPPDGGEADGQIDKASDGDWLMVAAAVTGAIVAIVVLFLLMYMRKKKKSSPEGGEHDGPPPPDIPPSPEGMAPMPPPNGQPGQAPSTQQQLIPEGVGSAQESFVQPRHL